MCSRNENTTSITGLVAAFTKGKYGVIVQGVVIMVVMVVVTAVMVGGGGDGSEVLVVVVIAVRLMVVVTAVRWLVACTNSISLFIISLLLSFSLLSSLTNTP